MLIFTQEAPITRKWFSGRSCIRSNWNLEVLDFLRRGENQSTWGIYLSEQRKNQQQTWPTYGPSSESNLGHISGRRVLSPLHQPCSRSVSLWKILPGCRMCTIINNNYYYYYFMVAVCLLSYGCTREVLSTRERQESPSVAL